MPLTEREYRTLREMEERLSVADPRLARTLSELGRSGRGASPWREMSLMDSTSVLLVAWALVVIDVAAALSGVGAGAVAAIAVAEVVVLGGVLPSLRRNAARKLGRPRRDPPV